MAEVPSHIRVNLSFPKQDHLLVYFFGDHNFAVLRDTKIQQFSSKHGERVGSGSKNKSFKQALQESQEWRDQALQESQEWRDQALQESQEWRDQTREESQEWRDQALQESQEWREQARDGSQERREEGSADEPPAPLSPTSFPSSPPSPSSPAPPSPIIVDSSAPITIKPTAPIESASQEQHQQHHNHHSEPSKSAIPQHHRNLPDTSIVTNIPLSAELAKIWEYTEVDEDAVDGYVVISSERNMSSLVNYYNEYKRKMDLLSSVPPKRVKTESNTQLQLDKPKLDPLHNNPLHTQSSLATFSNQTKMLSSSPLSSFTNFSLSSSSLPINTSTSSNKNSGDISIAKVSNYNIVGTATNGFTVVPFQGIVEGEGEDGFLVEFTVQGHTYRGFLIAHETFPALISPLVPPMTYSTPGFSPYSNLAKITAVSIGKQHQDRLVELGRLVVASALVPYAYPPPLYL